MQTKKSARKFAITVPTGFAPSRHGIAGAIVALGIAGVCGAAHGQTFDEALANAYLTNPGLQAARAELRALDETVNQAISNWRPNVEFNTNAGLSRDDSQSNAATTGSRERRELTRPLSAALSVDQNIYRGGQTTAEIAQRESEVKAQRAELWAFEQDVLLDAATSFMDVFRDQAVLELTQNNERVLNRQLEATRDRFSVGEVTRTDVSQAEARVARAEADRIQAKGDLESSRTRFERVVGMPAGRLGAPEGRPELLPGALESAITEAIKNNPNVISAMYWERAAQRNIRKIEGELYPQISVSGEFEKGEDTSSAGSQSESASVIATLRIPIYQQGAVSSRVRQAKQEAAQRRLQYDDEQRIAIEAARSAWETLATTRAQIEAFKVEIKSSEIALEGVRQEANVGSRTVLDVLDAEQELLDAQVNLVRAERDEFVAVTELVAAVGRLTAKEYKLPVDYYDEIEHYNKVRDKIYGLGK